jgi:hypothetical protein
MKNVFRYLVLFFIAAFIILSAISISVFTHPEQQQNPNSGYIILGISVIVGILVGWFVSGRLTQFLFKDKLQVPNSGALSKNQKSKNVIILVIVIVIAITIIRFAMAFLSGVMNPIENI